MKYVNGYFIISMEFKKAVVLEQDKKGPRQDRKNNLLIVKIA